MSGFPAEKITGDSKIADNGIAVEVSNGVHVWNGMFAPRTPLIIQAFILSEMGYGTIQQVYEALAPSQHVLEPFPEGLDVQKELAEYEEARKLASA